MQETILALIQSNSLLAFLGAFGAGSITAIPPCSLVSVPLIVGTSVALNKDLEGRKEVYILFCILKTKELNKLLEENKF